MFVSINKGIERESLKTVPDIAKEYLPDNDPHWWSSTLIDVRELDSSEVSEKLRSQ